ncbi:uncharacterized protein ACWYII_045505 [Salvelinus alpinus]
MDSEETTPLPTLPLMTESDQLPVLYCLVLRYMVTSLPEHWKPGPDFYGVSCEPVLVTAGAGVIGFLFWRSILSVKSKSYLKMVDRMKKLEQEKKEILQKVAELQQQGEELKEKQKLSEKSATLSLEKIQELEVWSRLHRSGQGFRLCQSPYSYRQTQ